MKKSLLLISLLSLIGLSSCSLDLTNIKYSNENLYTIGNIETDENVNSLEINYLLGEINVITSSDDKFRITEVTESPVDDDIKVRSYLSNGYMIIQPCKSGRVNYTTIKRTLTVEIPSSYSMNKIALDTVTVNHSISVDSKEYKINSVTGNTTIETTNFDLIDVDVVTGNTKVTIDNTFDVSINFEYITGNLFSSVTNNPSSEHKINVDAITGNLIVNYK